MGRRAAATEATRAPNQKPTPTAVGRVPLGVRLHRDGALLVMVLPAIIIMLTFVYVPLVGNVIAFMDYVPFIPFFENRWVGLANFERLFADPNFWAALGNTLLYTAMNLLFYFPVPIVLAIFVHSFMSPRVRGFLQSVLYLPHFLSWVIVIGLFQQTLGSAGILNQFLAQQGIATINLMQSPELFKFMIVAQTVWKDAGWGTIIFLAALTAIDDNLYESAALDGAGVWRRLWHITLPGIRPIIILLLILRLGDALSVGFEQFLLQREAVGKASAEVLDTYVYFNGVVAGNWSVGVAAGLFKGLIGLILILAANKIAHSLGEDGIYKSAGK